MKSFEWSSPTTVEEAVKLLAAADQSADVDELPRPMGGGQDLLTTMKDYITRPSRVVNLKSIPNMDRIQGDAKQGLKIGALVKLVELEEHPEIRASFPGLAQAAHSIATPQIRHLGTIGGNLCQRPRCWYFRLEEVICLKKGGTECYAAAGENKYHAILGGGPSYIVHPSDLATILVALGAELTIAGPHGNHDLPIEKFFKLPAVGSVRRENVLKDDEIVTEIRIPASAFAAKSTYLKFKERPSQDFAMSAAAAAVELGPDKKILQARLVLGGVAPIPWRVPKAEAALIGKTLDEKTIADVAALALEGAEPLEKNAYKVPLTQAIVRRALTSLAGNRA
ncbi:MAG: xanthine dehydrogenase family protein subunit M [Planctomycetota bacterium]|nr:xanthine dehydrogenase family protein subunit M [Planctomycetota bacterium]